MEHTTPHHHTRWILPVALLTTFVLGIITVDMLVARSQYLEAIKPHIQRYATTSHNLETRLGAYVTARKQELWPEAFVQTLELADLMKELELIQRTARPITPRWWKEHRALHFTLLQASYQLLDAARFLEDEIHEARRVVKRQQAADTERPIEQLDVTLLSTVQALRADIAPESIESTLPLMATAATTHQVFKRLVHKLYGLELNDFVT